MPVCGNFYPAFFILLDHNGLNMLPVCLSQIHRRQARIRIFVVGRQPVVSQHKIGGACFSINLDGLFDKKS